MSLELPSTSVSVGDGGLGIVTTPSEDVHVVMGCSSKGVLTPREITTIARLTEDFGAGPAPKTAGYSVGKTDAKVIFNRLPVTARAAETKDLTVPAGKTFTLPGTALDGFDISLVCTLAGTIGSAPGPSWKWSKDGGETYTTPASLGTGTTIVLTGTGLTATFTAADAYTLNQEITAWTIPAAQSIAPVTTTRGNPDSPSTCVMTMTGSPIDDYEIVLEWLVGGTVGTTGASYRYSLDGGRKWSPAKSLGTATSVELKDAVRDDETVSTGVTVALAAGTLAVGDKAEANAFGPSYQAADATAAIDVLMTAQLSWRFFHFSGWLSRTAIASIASKVQDLAASNAVKHTFVLFTARPKGTFEKASNWEARLVAEFAGFGDRRTGVGAGMARVTCPITGRANRRTIMLPVVARVVSKTLQVDPGRKLDGALGTDVQLHDDDHLLVEHDASFSSTLHAARFITLRTYYDEAGIWCTRGNLMCPEGSDFNRIAYRAVMDLGTTVFNRVMMIQIQNHLAVNPPANAYNAIPNAIPGALREPDARKIDRELITALKAALVDTGYASAVQARVSRTDNFLSTGKLTAQVRITPLGYVDSFEGDIAFTNPQFAAFQVA